MARAARKTGMAWAMQVAGLAWSHPHTARMRGGFTVAAGVGLAAAFATYNPADPSLNATAPERPGNIMGLPGALAADIGVQSLGLACALLALMMVVLGLSRVAAAEPNETRGAIRLRALVGTLGILTLAGALAFPPPPAAWPLAKGLGGLWGDALLAGLAKLFTLAHMPMARGVGAGVLAVVATVGLGWALGLSRLDLAAAFVWLREALRPKAPVRLPERSTRVARRLRDAGIPDAALDPAPESEFDAQPLKVKPPKLPPKQSAREEREAQSTFEFVQAGGFRLPELSMLAKPKPRAAQFDEGSLRQNAQLLESVLAEFGV
ncbi:MAG: cell division protein FtsK, partial [Phenylobacterium sp.]|nr:cell division protein FtsK [Phenylobacterium sp.]